jgi:hypothetical protein
MKTFATEVNLFIEKTFFLRTGSGFYSLGTLGWDKENWRMFYRANQGVIQCSEDRFLSNPRGYLRRFFQREDLHPYALLPAQESVRARLEHEEYANELDDEMSDGLAIHDQRYMEKLCHHRYEENERRRIS